MTKAAAQAKWNEIVHDRSDEVDPDDERDWFDMALGFFLALGFDVETAYELADQAKGVGT